jgi:hypothetical protein
MTLYIDTRPQLLWVLGQATTEYGVYDIDYNLGNGKIRAEFFTVEKDGWEPVLTSWFSEEVYTIDQAKLAAQADYEARTAERFRAVELPSKWIVGGSDHIVFVSGYNQALEDIHEAIAKATTP